MDMLSTKLNNVLALLVFLTVFCVGTRAAQVETLVVKLKNGSETAFFLKDKPQVKFEGTNLKVTSSAGDTTFALADVLQFTYDKRDTSGINETVTEPTGVIFKDDVLVVVEIGILVRAGTPSDTVNVVDGVAFGEINGLAEDRSQQHQAKNAE